MLVIPTKANTNVMYAFAAVIPPPGLKVSTDWPPPKIPARSRPCSKSVNAVSIQGRLPTTDVGYNPGKQHLGAKSCQNRGLTGTGTHIRSYAGIVLLRCLLRGLAAVNVWAYDRCPVLQIVGCLVVECICIGLLSDHLNVHARLRVLNDDAQIHLDLIIFPFCSP